MLSISGLNGSSHILNRILWFGLGLVVVAGLLIWRYQSPHQASITAQPRTVGLHRVEVPIEIDTGGQTINAAQVYLSFNPRQVQVDSVSRDHSIFTLWVTGQPAFSNAKGEISFAGGLPTPGFRGRGQIGSVRLVAKQAAAAQLTFRSDTAALLNDGQGTSIPLTLQPITVTIP